MKTKQQFMSDLDLSGNETNIIFYIEVDFDDLVDNTQGVQFLNEKVDEFVTEGYLMQDLSYSFSNKLDQNINICVQVGDASEWFEEAE